MPEGNRTRLDFLSALSEGGRGLVEWHASHGDVRHRDSWEDTLRMRGADGQEYHGERQSEECGHTGRAKAERAQRSRRERREAHHTQPCRSIDCRTSHKHGSKHARYARLMSQTQSSSASGREIHTGNGERRDKAKPNPPALYDITRTNAHDRAYWFIVQQRAIAAAQIAQPPLASREPQFGMTCRGVRVVDDDRV